jgi:uncharacterized protein (DUF1800 family)
LCGSIRLPRSRFWSRRSVAIVFALATIAAVSAHAQDFDPGSHGGPQPLAITAVGPKNVSLGKVDLKISGSSFIKGAKVILSGTQLSTQFQSARKLSAKTTIAPTPGDTYAVVVLNGDGKMSAPFPLVIGVKKPQVTYAAAFRFLEQATWGPTTADVLALQEQGFSKWLSHQQGLIPSQIPPPANVFNQYAQAQFMYNALNGQDQLRQRVAFALEQVFVISGLKIRVEGMVPYLNLLSQNAFANYKDVMKAVTLSPSMGLYLDMVNNDKPDPAHGTLPNENYAREFLQLFTIGTVMLNADGSSKLDNSGNPIATYDQTQIQNMARVLTGWTYPTQPAHAPQPHNPPYFIGPMIPVEINHDTNAKTVFGTTLPAGQTAEQDLDQMLEIVFQHQNVGPFVALRLIQHLVTSNPSPAYIQRIATVFANNGSGVRGDLGAVVNAILLDPEARQGDVAANIAPTGGHLREPVLYATAILRAIGAGVGPSNNLAEFINGYGLGQELLFPASVFNYYSPFFRIPGGAQAGPEYQLLTPSTAVLRADWVIGTLVGSGIGPAVMVNLAPFFELAPNDTVLINAIDMALFGGQMPPEVRDALKTAIDATPDPAVRTFNALFLGFSSAEYQVER